MKLQVKKHATSSQEKFVLMCDYNGKKYIESKSPGEVIDVADDLGMALLAAPNLKGVLSIYTAPVEPEAKMVDTAPQNKMAPDSKTKKAIAEL
jgi:hypothetical protein